VRASSLIENHASVVGQVGEQLRTLGGGREGGLGRKKTDRGAVRNRWGRSQGGDIAGIRAVWTFLKVIESSAYLGGDSFRGWPQVESRREFRECQKHSAAWSQRACV